MGLPPVIASLALRGVSVGLALVWVVAARGGEWEREAARLAARIGTARMEQRQDFLRELRKIGPEARGAIPTTVKSLTRLGTYFESSDALAAMGGEAVRPLRGMLRSRSRDLCGRALWTIGWMNRDAGPLLPDILALTTHPDFERRHRAIGALRRITPVPPEVVAQLARLISENAFNPPPKSAADFGSYHVAEDTITTLWEMGPLARDAAPALVEVVRRAPQDYHRERAMWALVAIDPEAEATALALAANLSAGPGVPMSRRTTAAFRLAAIGPSARPAAPELLKQLRDPDLRSDCSFYSSVTRALAAAGEKAAIRDLRRDLRHEGQRPDDSSLREEELLPKTYDDCCLRACAARALAQFEPEDEEVFRVLRALAADARWVEKTRPGALGYRMFDPCSVAAEGLASLGSRAEGALPELKEVLRSDPPRDGSFCTSAAWAIACIDPEDRDCVTRLGRDLVGRDPREVARVLGERSEAVVPRILDESLDFNGSRRQSEVELICALGPAAVRQMVERALALIETPPQWHHPSSVYPSLDTLGSRAAPATDLLLARLEAKNHLVRAQAARLLGAIGREGDESLRRRCAAALRPLLADERVLVRVRAIEALAACGPADRETTRDLQRLTKDPYVWVRDTAHEAIHGAEESR